QVKCKDSATPSGSLGDGTTVSGSGGAATGYCMAPLQGAGLDGAKRRIGCGCTVQNNVLPLFRLTSFSDALKLVAVYFH
ncbi:MAG: hypothetical protein P8Z30_10385, partial [Acidobacteriota bacterium]